MICNHDNEDMPAAQRPLKPSAPKTGSPALDLALQFSDLQGERSRVFNDFKAGFKLFLVGEASLKEYKQLVAAVTPVFSSISSSIKEIAAEMEGRGGGGEERKQDENGNEKEQDRESMPRLDKYLSFLLKVQSLEQRNLIATVKYQELMTETTFGEIDHSIEAKEVSEEILGVEEDITACLQEMRELMLDTEEL